MSVDPDESAIVQTITTQHVHVYFHPDPIEVVLDPITVNVQFPRPEGTPVTAILTIGGSLMPATISIDDTSGSARIFWVDDKGDTDAAAPAGAQVAFAVDNPAIATIDPASGVITPVAEGSSQVTASITGADGNPLLEPDGVTPFAVSAGPFSVVAGTAVGAGLEVKA